jgi:hypothetical protein
MLDEFHRRIETLAAIHDTPELASQVRSSPTCAREGESFVIVADVVSAEGCQPTGWVGATKQL